MKTNLRLIVLSGLVLTSGWVVQSCKKDKPKAPPVVVADALSVKVYPMYGNEVLHLDSTYQTTQGYDIQFTDLKFLGCNWKNGSATLMQAALFDYRESGNNFIQVEKKPDDFAALQGLLGVESTLNHSDPTAFPDNSVLNITNAGGMHWGWNPGYIFMKVEVKIDTIPDGVPLFDHYAVLHVGTDAFLQTLDFPAVNWTLVSEKSYTAKMKLDMKQFLTNGTQAIDLKTENTTHSAPGQEALSLKAIQNFKASLGFMN